MTKDVVCGMRVDETTALYKTQYKGTTYPFCSQQCRIQFEQKPEAYANEAAQATK